MSKEESLIPRVPWNKGKRKPTEDEFGIKWCNCESPKLTRNTINEEKGQAQCQLCTSPWYH